MDFKGSDAVKSSGLSSSTVSYAAVTKPDTPCLRSSGMSSTYGSSSSGTCGKNDGLALFSTFQKLRSSKYEY